jgi:glucuronosyltransferase
MNKVSLFLALTIVIINLSCGERILVFLPISSKSVNNVFESLINGLANKGHTITTVSSVRSLHHENVTQIIPIPTEELFGNLANPFELRKLSPLKRISALSPNLLKFCEVIYEHPEIQMMVKNPRGRFDLLIINAASNHCFFGLIHSFNVPIVSLMTLPPANFVTEKFGVHLPYSFVI